MKDGIEKESSNEKGLKRKQIKIKSIKIKSNIKENELNIEGCNWKDNSIKRMIYWKDNLIKRIIKK